MFIQLEGCLKALESFSPKIFSVIFSCAFFCASALSHTTSLVKSAVLNYAIASTIPVQPPVESRIAFDTVLYQYSALLSVRLQPWMYLLCMAAFVLLVAILVKIRNHKLTKEKEVLERIVQERTHEVIQQMKIVQAQKDEAQRQRMEAERQRQLVEKKNTEIMEQLAKTEASLSSLTHEMIERFHAYTELELELKKLAENGDPNKFKRVFSLITTNKSLDREWEQFNLSFDGIYKDFHNKLRGRVRQLSNYDLRLCALIKMGFENQEIAMLLNIEVTSVKMAKYRLRKKLQVEDPVDLQEFFEML